MNCVTRWRRIRRIRKRFLLKRPTLVAVHCVAVEKQCRRGLFVLAAPSGRTEAFVSTVLEAITRNPRKVVQRLAQKTEALTSNAWRCYTDRLLFPYRVRERERDITLFAREYCGV
jgi:hypothetical protein